jgi:hypothetical protein
MMAAYRAKQTYMRHLLMSAYGSEADIRHGNRPVCFLTIFDIETAVRRGRFL